MILRNPNRPAGVRRGPQRPAGVRKGPGVGKMKMDEAYCLLRDPVAVGGRIQIPRFFFQGAFLLYKLHFVRCFREKIHYFKGPAETRRNPQRFAKTRRSPQMPRRWQMPMDGAYCLLRDPVPCGGRIQIFHFSYFQGIFLLYKPHFVRRFREK